MKLEKKNNPKQKKTNDKKRIIIESFLHYFFIKIISFLLFSRIKIKRLVKKKIILTPVDFFYLIIREPWLEKLKCS
jgi:hypothetical protein